MNCKKGLVTIHLQDGQFSILIPLLFPFLVSQWKGSELTLLPLKLEVIPLCHFQRAPPCPWLLDFRSLSPSLSLSLDNTLWGAGGLFSSAQCSHLDLTKVTLDWQERNKKENDDQARGGPGVRGMRGYDWGGQGILLHICTDGRKKGRKKFLAEEKRAPDFIALQPELYRRNCFLSPSSLWLSTRCLGDAGRCMAMALPCLARSPIRRAAAAPPLWPDKAPLAWVKTERNVWSDRHGRRRDATATSAKKCYSVSFSGISSLNKAVCPDKGTRTRTRRPEWKKCKWGLWKRKKKNSALTWARKFSLFLWG